MTSPVGMTSIVKTIARLVAGFMFVYGAYVVIHGHLTPGGGFAGGVVIAGAFVLQIVANGLAHEAARKEKDRASRLEAGAIFAFWAIALLGILAATFWFQNYPAVGEAFALQSGGLIPASNIAIGVEVAAALVCIYVAFLLVRRGGQS